MLNRLTVATLLKTVIAIMSSCVVLILLSSAWDSWSRLGEAKRILVVAEASSNLFKAMNNLRTDRSTTSRLLNSDQPMDAAIETYLRGLRDVEMPAMATALTQLGDFDFPEQKTLVPELARLFSTLTAQQKEFWNEVGKPKASRRASLSTEYMDTTTALVATLDKLSGRLAANVNHADAEIDQLLAIKQTAWLLRSTAGEGSLLISNGLAAGKVAPEAKQAYTRLLGGTETAWNALELAQSGMRLPAPLVEAMAATKAAYFDPSYLALRDRLLDALMTGAKPELTANQWSPLTVERMSKAVNVADAALDAAKAHAGAQSSDAWRALILRVIFLAVAIALAVGSVIAISRRVITPLHKIRDAMLKVASGDLAVTIGYVERSDEIGSLAGALGTFKQQAEAKEQTEQLERVRNVEAAKRQQSVDGYIGAFEGQVRQTLELLGDAASQMRTTSEGMSEVSSQANDSIRIAARASGDASASVQSVASASEQLSASINDISRQASHASEIASRAVSQAQETDGTVQGLAKTANRIGEVVGLINDIASQTNLLALNATIEAARAGESGRGFAVVASEVKSLASQTAKATEDISEQIADMQKVANEAIDAIKAIGGIIGEVNEVATAIAAAVEQQGAATQEITRNTQQAAQGTKNVSDNIGSVTAGADATGAAAENVKQASQTLGTQAQQLRHQVDDFLDKIRAA
ncbi:MAG: methyl-accepting chemotaxis protein [Rhodopseudomonas sp.]|uniref:methyl-accepting chemotaxis protein n=1 Tax=Rhodopseudomonas sp. TaxID=1078 RepID=UPI0017A7F49F|nr:HAMP domain-containing methyl-accepting chemotaxis protein [Rhodopseudomonas sp.]NVN88024.1 methyl-accepting chemotaxis protein [Rhodopseudomonas sp.]